VGWVTITEEVNTLVSWETEESSGLLDDADVTINQAYFGTDARYQSGEQLLFVIEGTSPQADEDEVRQFWSIGGGWEAIEGGAKVEGKEKFNTSSAYARFFNAALQIPGVSEIIQDRGTPDEAAIWEGLTFHMERQDVEYGGQIGTRQMLLPVSLVEGKKKAVPKKPAAKKAASNSGGDKALRAKLKNLAKKSDDFDGFLDALHEQYPEVADNTELYDEALDEDRLFVEANG